MNKDRLVPLRKSDLENSDAEHLESRAAARKLLDNFSVGGFVGVLLQNPEQSRVVTTVMPMRLALVSFVK
jgi:hypothetical protein